MILQTTLRMRTFSLLNIPGQIITVDSYLRNGIHLSFIN